MSHEQVIEEINEYIYKKEAGYQMDPLDLETLRRWSTWLAEDWDYDCHRPSYDQGYQAREDDEEVEKEERIVELEEEVEQLKKQLSDLKEEATYDLDEAVESAIAIKDNVIKLRDRMKEL